MPINAQASKGSCPYNETHNLSAQQIADAWIKGGGSKESCPAALIVASGEGAPAGSGPSNFYSANASNGAGIGGPWQVEQHGDSPACYKNPCCNATAVLSKLKRCETGPNKIPSKTPKFNGINSDVGYSGQGLGGHQDNFIGPFCHGPEDTPGNFGVMFGGGSKWEKCEKGMYCRKNPLALVPVDNDNKYPFPWYYYDKYNQQMGIQTELCEGITPGKKLTPTLIKCLNKITKTAIDSAKNLCNNVN